MRYLVLFISVGLLLMAGVSSAQKKSTANFSGKWALNEEKSDLGTALGGRRSMIASKLVVEQKDNKLVVEAFRTDRDGQEVSTVDTYTLDGKECKNESNNRTSVSVAKWSADGKTLTISSTITMSRGGQEFTMEATEIWSVDKEALTLDSTRTTPRGERKSKAVYTKSEK